MLTDNAGLIAGIVAAGVVAVVVVIIITVVVMVHVFKKKRKPVAPNKEIEVCKTVVM